MTTTHVERMKEIKLRLASAVDPAAEHIADDCKFLLARIERLEAALRWYAAHSSWVASIDTAGATISQFPVFSDCGARAREALAGGDE